jgi:ribosomal protein S6--L-glutamate ligase
MQPSAGEADADALPPVLRVGWREWVGLPELGLPAVRAKVDTGARTSALHATDLEVAEAEGGVAVVRFRVQPVRKHPEVVFDCEAEVVDRRTVRSSNGRAQERYVIRTPVALAGQTWSIEVTLARRDRMTHRMLLGRTALAGRCLVDPSTTYATGRALARAYRR